MPLRNGTGPIGGRPGGGRGIGRGGGGRGRQPGGYGLGPAGFCVCPVAKCGERVPHQRGLPCYETVCPKCGSRMVRER